MTTRILSFRISEEQYAELDAEARATKKTKAAVIRNQAKATKPSKPIP